MSWWNLPGSKTEWMGDSSADAASEALAPLEAAATKPTVDQVLDALEVVLGASELVSDAPLGERTLEIYARPRERSPAQPALVHVLREGLPTIVASYRDSLERAPTLRELVYTIAFVFLGAVETYTSDGTGDLGNIKIR